MDNKDLEIINYTHQQEVRENSLANKAKQDEQNNNNK